MRTVANIKRKKSNQMEVHFCDESKLTLSEELISKHSLCKGLDVNEEKFTLGINAQLMHYLLMAMVAVTTVAAFESVGSIIVIAMLVVPAATAQLLTDNLKIMLVISAVVGVLAAVMGHISAIIVPPMLGFDGTSTSGMIAGSAGLLFMFVWLLAPRYGLLVKLFSSRKIEVPEVGISRDSACPK